MLDGVLSCEQCATTGLSNHGCDAALAAAACCYLLFTYTLAAQAHDVGKFHTSPLITTSCSQPTNHLSICRCSTHVRKNSHTNGRCQKTSLTLATQQGARLNKKEGYERYSSDDSIAVQQSPQAAAAKKTTQVFQPVQRTY